MCSYVMSTDRGSAPNYDGGAVTLAICKPRVRRKGQPGDLLLGFNGSALSSRPNSLRWAGLVAEVMALEDYWEDPRFKTKQPGHSNTPDNIYRSENGTTIQVPNSSHDCANMETDLSGRNTLICGKAWHFGDDGPELPEYFGLHVPMNARRTEPLREIPRAVWIALEAWLDHNDAGLPVATGLQGKGCSSRAEPSRTLRAGAGPRC
ncbi:Nmad2 family putative nucleotide modification protein [Erythrobacter aurantius]|uniref:Nmad2 family putative nucleotide modification protein n=1 Tax=Erythrobacter aurantius TaxID=2909249 RepID=UPI0038B2BFA4